MRTYDPTEFRTQRTRKQLNNGRFREPRCDAKAHSISVFSSPKSGGVERSQPSAPNPANLSLPWPDSPYHLHPKLPGEDFQVRQLQPLLLRCCIRLSRSLCSKASCFAHQFLQRSSSANHKCHGGCKIHG
jgi:hypothetical protein